MEIWKDIKDYEGLYQVSNYGKIKSLSRKVNDYRGGIVKKEKLLTPTDNGKGYQIIGLCKNNHRKNHYIHRLVADAFLENPNNYPQVNHKDYNTKNNCVDNLEWITTKDNIIYSLPNRPATTKRTNQYGKYIKRDKRYSGFVVIVGLRDKSRKYLGRFENLEEARKQRDSFLREIV